MAGAGMDDALAIGPLGILHLLDKDGGGNVVLLLAGCLDLGSPFGHGEPCLCRVQVPFPHIRKAADFRVAQALLGTRSVMAACGRHDDPILPTKGAGQAN
jgi:hypothetical protein